MKRILISILTLSALILAPISAVGTDSAAKLRDPLTQQEPSENASASTSERPPGEAAKAGEERQQSWLERHVTFMADVRAALASNSRRERGGGGLTKVTPRIRLRGGAAVSFLPRLGVTARLALGIDDDIEGFDFRFRHRRNIGPGDLTLDELFLTLKPHEFLTIKGGRLQTEGHPFEVDSVVEDSLSRHDSSGLDIDWTDGVYVMIGSPSSFKLHLIGQANPEEGPTNGVGVRGPLDFEDGASRITYYVGVEAPPLKPFTQLVADVTIIPQALRPSGLGTKTKEDVVAFAIRGAADFPLPGMKSLILHPFGEVGAMVSTPRENVLKVSKSRGRADRFAFVAGLDLKNLGPGSLGFQFGWTQAGYLISPDYPNNAWSIETRYKVGIFKNAVFELRYRHRQDIERLVGALHRQTDDNVLARVTIKF